MTQNKMHPIYTIFFGLIALASLVFIFDISRKYYYQYKATQVLHELTNSIKTVSESLKYQRNIVIPKRKRTNITNYHIDYDNVDLTKPAFKSSSKKVISPLYKKQSIDLKNTTSSAKNYQVIDLKTSYLKWDK